MKKTNLEIRSILWLALAFAYLLIRFGFTPQLDALGSYSSYIFEVLCVSVAAALFGKKLISILNVNKSVAYGSIATLAAGFAVFKLANILNVGIPFDFKGSEILVFLLIVSPILEELIFRFLLWHPIQFRTQRPIVAWILTSFIFSYSHLHAIWFVPPELHPFILYQTGYTLPLGLACGFFVYRFSSLTGAMLIHFAFNLGFYLASIM